MYREQMPASRRRGLVRRGVYEAQDHCREPECDAPSIDAGRCPQHWDELVGTTRKRAARAYSDASEFYIGRTNFPEVRLLEHFVDTDGARRRMAILHWSACWSEIMLLEERLISSFGIDSSRLKGANKDPKSSGTLSGSWNCVYGVWAPRARDLKIKSSAFREVTSLDASQREWPERLTEASLLRFRGTVPRAKELLCQD